MSILEKPNAVKYRRVTFPARTTSCFYCVCYSVELVRCRRNLFLAPHGTRLGRLTDSPKLLVLFMPGCKPHSPGYIFGSEPNQVPQRPKMRHGARTPTGYDWRGAPQERRARRAAIEPTRQTSVVGLPEVFSSHRIPRKLAFPGGLFLNQS